jgi:hypothetical protein
MATTTGSLKTSLDVRDVTEQVGQAGLDSVEVLPP